MAPGDSMHDVRCPAANPASTRTISGTPSSGEPAARRPREQSRSQVQRRRVPNCSAATMSEASARSMSLSWSCFMRGASRSTASPENSYSTRRPVFCICHRVVWAGYPLPWQSVPYVLDSTLALCYCCCHTFHYAASVISTEETPTHGLRCRGPFLPHGFRSWLAAHPYRG